VQVDAGRRAAAAPGTARKATVTFHGSPGDEGPGQPAPAMRRDAAQRDAGDATRPSPTLLRAARLREAARCDATQRGALSAAGRDATQPARYRAGRWPSLTTLRRTPLAGPPDTSGRRGPTRARAGQRPVLAEGRAPPATRAPAYANGPAGGFPRPGRRSGAPRARGRRTSRVRVRCLSWRPAPRSSCASGRCGCTSGRSCRRGCGHGSRRRVRRRRRWSCRPPR
jgi:hypothetical protein